MDRSGPGSGTAEVCGWGDLLEMTKDATNHGRALREGAPQNEGGIKPIVLRANGNVQILIEASAAQSLLETIKAAGLIVAPPVLKDYHDLVKEFDVEPQKGQSCLVVSDPDHLIADVIARWKRDRSEPAHPS